MFWPLECRLSLTSIKSNVRMWWPRFGGGEFVRANPQIYNHLFKHLSHRGTTRLLLWLHPSSGDDPLVRVPTAAHQENLSKGTKTLRNTESFISLWLCFGFSDQFRCSSSYQTEAWNHNLMEEESHFLPIWFRRGGNTFLAPDCRLRFASVTCSFFSVSDWNWALWHEPWPFDSVSPKGQMTDEWWGLCYLFSVVAYGIFNLPLHLWNIQVWKINSPGSSISTWKYSLTLGLFYVNVIWIIYLNTTDNHISVN